VWALGRLTTAAAAAGLCVCDTIPNQINQPLLSSPPSPFVIAVHHCRSSLPLLELALAVAVAVS